MQVTNKKNADGSMQIILDFDIYEVKALKHDLPGDQGIIDWYAAGPSFHKIGRCKERMLNQESPKLRAKGLSIPPDDNTLLDLILADADYKDREARDLEEKALNG